MRSTFKKKKNPGRLNKYIIKCRKHKFEYCLNYVYVVHTLKYYVRELLYNSVCKNLHP